MPVGKSPHGVAVDPGTHTVYITNYADGTVSVLDGSTRTVTATVPVGEKPCGVAPVDRVAHTIYVTNYSGHGVCDRTSVAFPSGLSALVVLRTPGHEDIVHLRDVLGEQTYESLAHKGEAMTTAAIVAYAYDQIDQARAELNAVLK